VKWQDEDDVATIKYGPIFAEAWRWSVWWISCHCWVH